MKSFLIAISLAVAGLAFSVAPSDVEAKRLGAGKPAGMQRQAPAKSPEGTPATPAATPGANAAAPAAAAAAAPKRNWMGPLAGLAAGLGLAALFSHMGMGEGMGNMVMMLLIGVALFFVVRMLMARFGKGGTQQGAGGMQQGAGGMQQGAGGMQLAGAGASAGGGLGGGGMGSAERVDPTLARSSLADAPSAAPVGNGFGGVGAAAVAAPPAIVNLPDGMPAVEFERVAKLVFIRLQAANDANNVDDLKRFTTPELFASLKADLLERNGAAQKTDVVQLDAKVVEAVTEGSQHIVSVRFQGLIREAADAGAEHFDEMWHLVRPVDAKTDWAIAGIAPTN